MLLSEIDKEERERRWYYSQLQGLSQRLNQLPRIDTVRALFNTTESPEYSLLHGAQTQWTITDSSTVQSILVLSIQLQEM